MKKMFFISILIVSVTFIAHAQTTGQIIHNHYQSPRAMGMGNAMIAAANDYSMLFYNPASFATLDEGELNMSLMDISGAVNFATFVSNLSKTVGGSYANSTAQAQAIGEFLQSQYGNPYSFRLKLFEAIWVRPGWGFGFIPMDLTMDMQAHNQGFPALDFRTYADTTFAYGKGWHISGVPGRMSWGVTGKFVNRGNITKLINTADLAQNSNLIQDADFKEGFTIDADLGLLYSPYIPTEGFWSALQLAKPTFALVARNVGEFGFKNSMKLLNKNVTDEPEKLYRVFDIGSKWEYPTLGIFGGRGTLDIRDIGHPAWTFTKGFHMGFEFDWSMASWWKGQYRVGINQGYLTAGMSAQFTTFCLDLATWGEEVGSDSAKKENRTILIKLNLNI